MTFWQWLMSLFGLYNPTPTPPPPTPPQWQIHGTFDNKPVVVGAGPNYGGAIYSLTWGGQQLINQDPANGGQMQTAYYVETPPGLTNAINPTEAGNYLDHVSPQGSTTGSTTIITGEYLASDHLQTLCHPAYWSGAYQGSLTSPDVLGKTATLKDNTIHLQYNVQFNGNHPSCAVETCWYMPFNFTAYYDPVQGFQVPNPQGVSHTSDYPMIACTPDGSLACAIYSNAPNKVYGWGWDQKYPKINIYFPALGSITSGQTFIWDAYAIFGTLDEVKTCLANMKQ